MSSGTRRPRLPPPHEIAWLRPGEATPEPAQAPPLLSMKTARRWDYREELVQWNPQASAEWCKHQYSPPLSLPL